MKVMYGLISVSCAMLMGFICNRICIHLTQRDFLFAILFVSGVFYLRFSQLINNDND